MDLDERYFCNHLIIRLLHLYFIEKNCRKLVPLINEA